MHLQENANSPKFKTLIFDNDELKNNKEQLDNVCEINMGAKLSINNDKEKNQVNQHKPLKDNYFKIQDTSKTQETLNKKRKNNSNGKHTKFSEDNLQRKCITMILNIILEFINNSILKIYNGNIGHGINCKRLTNVNIQPDFFKVDITKNLLHKTLGEIFSDKISTRFTNYLPNHNILMIKNLLAEKDLEKKKHLEKLFGITFLQCVEKFVGMKNSEELEGFITYNEYKDKLNNDPKYLQVLKDYLINFEENVNKKKSKSKKKKKNNRYLK